MTRTGTRLNRWLVFTACVVLVAALGYLDYLSGTELGFSLIYIAPVALAAWLVGPYGAATVSLLASTTWYLADLWAGSIYTHGLIPVWNAVMHLGIFFLMVWALTLLKREMDAREELSREDPLTGACNSRCFYQRAEQELKRSRRYGSPLSFAYIDLDNFKQVNDTMGHSAGDDLLRLVVDTISGNVRAVDIMARMGGDEFALLLPETDYFGSGVAVEKMKELLDHRMSENDWPVTFSIGVVTYERPPESVEEMIREADTLMYLVKGTTKDSVHHEVRGTAEGGTWSKW